MVLIESIETNVKLQDVVAFSMQIAKRTIQFLFFSDLFVCFCIVVLSNFVIRLNYCYYMRNEINGNELIFNAVHALFIVISYTPQSFPRAMRCAILIINVNATAKTTTTTITKMDSKTRALNIFFVSIRPQTHIFHLFDRKWQCAHNFTIWMEE